MVMAIGSDHLQPVIAQLAEHLTVDFCSDQMVPGSIPGDRISVTYFHHLADDGIPLPATAWRPTIARASPHPNRNDNDMHT